MASITASSDAAASSSAALGVLRTVLSPTELKMYELQCNIVNSMIASRRVEPPNALWLSLQQELPNPDRILWGVNRDPYLLCSGTLDCQEGAIADVIDVLGRVPPAEWTAELEGELLQAATARLQCAVRYDLFRDATATSEAARRSVRAAATSKLLDPYKGLPVGSPYGAGAGDSASWRQSGGDRSGAVGTFPDGMYSKIRVKKYLETGQRFPWSPPVPEASRKCIRYTRMQKLSAHRDSLRRLWHGRSALRAEVLKSVCEKYSLPMPSDSVTANVLAPGTSVADAADKELALVEEVSASTDLQKKKRIVYLFRKTAECLRELGLRLEREAAAGDDVAAAGNPAGAVEDALPEDDDDVAAIYDRLQSVQDSYFLSAHGTTDEVTKQPSGLTGQLKRYQLQALQWLFTLHRKSLSGILADEMGLGKTIETIALLQLLAERPVSSGGGLGCSIIVVPLAVIDNWSSELRLWAPRLRVVRYGGPPDQRKHLFDNVLKGGHFDVCLLHFEVLRRDISRITKLQWDYLVVDEGHRIKSEGSLIFTALKGMRTRHRLLLTGTPLQNNLKELWTLLNFILPSVFNESAAVWKWFADGCGTGESDGELNRDEEVLVIGRLHSILRPFVLRREKHIVEQELPKKLERSIGSNLSGLQRLLYVQAQHQKRIQDEPGTRPSHISNPMMILRKLCNHPFLILRNPARDVVGCPEGPDGKGWGAWSDPKWIRGVLRFSGKFAILVHMLAKLKKTGHRVLLFSQRKDELTLLEHILLFFQWDYCRTDGDATGEEREAAKRAFLDAGSTKFIFLLTTRAGGTGLNLQAADTAFLLDRDFNPTQDAQAAARLHRIGQDREVRVFSLLSRTPLEEHVESIAAAKRQEEQRVIGAGQFDNTTSTEDRRQLLLESALRSPIETKAEDGTDASVETVLMEINLNLARSDEEREILEQFDIDNGTVRPESMWHPCSDEGAESIPTWLRQGNPGITAASAVDSKPTTSNKRKRKVNWDLKISEADQVAFAPTETVLASRTAKESSYTQLFKGMQAESASLHAEVTSSDSDVSTSDSSVSMS